MYLHNLRWSHVQTSPVVSVHKGIFQSRNFAASPHFSSPYFFSEYPFDDFSSKCHPIMSKCFGALGPGAVCKIKIFLIIILGGCKCSLQLLSDISLSYMQSRSIFPVLTQVKIYISIKRSSLCSMSFYVKISVYHSVLEGEWVSIQLFPNNIASCIGL